jgi:predicted cupin superfamily sugar epimerase
VTARAAELVRALGLAPHPEGGHFRETHRSSLPAATADGRSRPALTHIWFLLAGAERSRWHRLASDEIWLFHEGDPLELLTIAPGTLVIERRRLGPAGPAEGGRAGGSPGPGAALPAAAVPAGSWQAARPAGAYTLASCVVAPGFAYEDFELLADRPAERDRLLRAGLDLGDAL